jgi:hypothetical protein
VRRAAARTGLKCLIRARARVESGRRGKGDAAKGIKAGVSAVFPQAEHAMIVSMRSTNSIMRLRSKSRLIKSFFAGTGLPLKS